jgi:CHAT domain-containing protein
MGEYDRALEFFLRSLALAEELDYKDTVVNHLRNIANIYYEKGDYEKSLEYAERSITIARQIGSRKDLWTGLETRGRAYRALKQTEKAREDFEEAIATIENWRYLVAGGESEQQSLFAETVSPYHEMIDLLVSDNLPGDALEYAERAKARVLLDILSSGRINIYKTMTPLEQEKEKDWEKQLGSLNKQVLEEKSNPQADPTLLVKLDTQLQSARLSFETFRAELYLAHPELRAQRGEARIIQQEEINNLLDAHSAILEFVVTEEKILVFILTRESNSSPVSSAIHVININELDLSKRVEDFRKRIADRDARFRQPSVELYDLLLRPAEKELYGKTKLIIIPDGALWELPFQALSSRDRYLLEDYSVFYAPSITVLHEMKKLHREQSEPNNTRLFALGNPTLNKKIREQVNQVYRDKALDPLPEAETEVKELSKLYGFKASKVYIGAEAREDRVKAETDSFNVLHIATHAIVNDITPMYSQVLLSPGNHDEDGMLEAWEIVNLRLKADLVVLSACETALGKVRNGEGMIGLTWAFFVTGVSAEVVSQWKVASVSTTALMLSFHRQLRANMPKAEALQKAELELSHDKRYHHPFYWASFVLVGDGD